MAKQRDRGKERYWRRHVAGWRRSGLSIRAYCRSQRLAEPSFYAWRRVLAERALQDAMGSGKQSDSATAALPAFVPVRLIEEASAAAALEVVLRGGRVVRVPVGFAAAALRELVVVLEGLPC